MLVLTRKLNESISIGNDVTVTIVAIHGNRIKLGISAPDSCRVLRAELVIQDEAPEQGTTRVAKRKLPGRRADRQLAGRIAPEDRALGAAVRNHPGVEPAVQELVQDETSHRNGIVIAKCK